MTKNPAIMLSRIFSMFLIILCHIIKFYTFVPGSQMLNQILNVGVFVFLIISGFLYGSKSINNFKTFYIKRVQRIMIPVFFVSLFYIILLYIVAGERINALSIFAYLFNFQGLGFIQWKFFSKFIHEITGLGPLWFTTIIMICYLFIPVLQKFRTKLRGNKFITLSLIIISLVLIYFVNILTGITLSYFMAFIIGYICGYQSFDSKLNFKSFTVISFFTFAMQAARIILRSKFDGTAYYSAFTGLSHIALGIWIVFFFFTINNYYTTPPRVNLFAKISDSKLLNYLDGMSFYIYLTHGIFCMGTFSLYAKFDNLLVASIMFFVLSFVCAVILKFITDKINNSITNIKNKQ